MTDALFDEPSDGWGALPETTHDPDEVDRQVRLLILNAVDHDAGEAPEHTIKFACKGWVNLTAVNQMLKRLATEGVLERDERSVNGLPTVYWKRVT